MLRIILLALAIGLVADVLPAAAQGGGCAGWCLSNKCNGGGMEKKADPHVGLRRGLSAESQAKIGGRAAGT